MKFLTEKATRKVLYSRLLVLLFFVALLMPMAAVGCGSDTDAIQEQMKRDRQKANQTQTVVATEDNDADPYPWETDDDIAYMEDTEGEFADIAGEYVHPQGTIFLNADGTYSTINSVGSTTSGTYTVSGNTISFHQTAPQAVEGTGTIENGVITNSAGQFVKK